jgi:2,4-dienoyl-CoA reductase (NADPH2)
MRVTLLERSSQLGGTLFFAALPYPENGKLLDNLVHQVRQLPIDVRLNTEASPQMLRELGADHVLVANGASRVPPHIPGADGAHVWSGDELRRLMTGDRAQQVARSKLSVLQRGMLMAGTLIGATRSTSALRQLSRLWMPLGKQVVIIGGGLVGLELAEFLAERGRSVSVVEPTESLGRELSIVRRWRVLDNLRKHSVAMHRQTSVVAIDQCQVHCLDENGGAFSLPADSVVIALGAAPQGDLAEQLTRSGIAVSRIGDCNEVGYIEGALRSATDAVLAL